MRRQGSAATNRTLYPSQMSSRGYPRVEAGQPTGRRWSVRGFVKSRIPVREATRGECTSRRTPGAMTPASASRTCSPVPRHHLKTPVRLAPSSSARGTPPRCSCPRPHIHREPTWREPRRRGVGTAPCPCCSRASRAHRRDRRSRTPASYATCPRARAHRTKPTMTHLPAG